MSELNRKGPNNQGSGSGRGLGKCNPENKGKSNEEIEEGRASAPFHAQNPRGIRRGKGMRRRKFQQNGEACRYENQSDSFWSRLVNVFSKTK